MSTDNEPLLDQHDQTTSDGQKPVICINESGVNLKRIVFKFAKWRNYSCQCNAYNQLGCITVQLKYAREFHWNSKRKKTFLKSFFSGNGERSFVASFNGIRPIAGWITTSNTWRTTTHSPGWMSLSVCWESAGRRQRMLLFQIVWRQKSPSVEEIVVSLKAELFAWLTQQQKIERIMNNTMHLSNPFVVIQTNSVCQWILTYQ